MLVSLPCTTRCMKSGNKITLICMWKPKLDTGDWGRTRAIPLLHSHSLSLRKAPGKLRPRCHGLLGYVGRLRRLLDLRQVPDPRRQQLLSEVWPRQTLGKPPHVGTEESHVPLSPLLSTLRARAAQGAMCPH